MVIRGIMQTSYYLNLNMADLDMNKSVPIYCRRFVKSEIILLSVSLAHILAVFTPKIVL